MTDSNAWPPLPYEEWSDTLATLHMWTQIVGKIRLSLTPWTNHSWHVPLYVTSRGLTTSTMYQGGRRLDIEFDFRDHVLAVRPGDLDTRLLPLEPRTVADFHSQLLSCLAEVGFNVDIYGVPSEVQDPIPFAQDTTHKSYDANAATHFAQVLNHTTRVFSEFRAGFIGKCSPVHFFWGSFDLAVTRFSGRSAPPHPGGIPGLPDWVTREAYSHEVYSCGFWPGGEAGPAAAFYAYAYPTPAQLGDANVSPGEAFWSPEMGEFFLPYDAVRAAADPDTALREFLTSTYEAVADLAKWDRESLEAPAGFPRSLLNSPRT